jgi:co-chaperonin GroES (HSP10)
MMKDHKPSIPMQIQQQTPDQLGAELIKRSILQAEAGGNYYDPKVTLFVAKPDNGWIICRRHVVTKTPGGIDIPEIAQQAYFEAMAVGEGQVTFSGVRVPMLYQVGDLLITDTAPNALMYEGVALFFINQASVKCKVTRPSFHNFSDLK